MLNKMTLIAAATLALYGCGGGSALIQTKCLKKVSTSRFKTPFSLPRQTHNLATRLAWMANLKVT